MARHTEWRTYGRSQSLEQYSSHQGRCRRQDRNHLNRIDPIAKAPLDADVETQQKVMKLMEMLDDHDDVQNVYTNLNITDETAA
jgi:transcriptional/translational regulatory protein YebC/TACO1